MSSSRPAAGRHVAKRKRLSLAAGPALAVSALALLASPRAALALLGEAAGGGQPARGATGGDALSNRGLRHQRLIADPNGAQSGSTTVVYDVNDVSLQSVFQAPGPGGTSPLYSVTGGYVGVLVGSVSAAQSLQDFFSHPAGPEFGYVQVQWSTPQSSPPFYGATPDSLTGYFDNGRFGKATPSNGGEDTFALQFLYLVNPDTAAQYEIEEDAQTFPIYDYRTGSFGANNSPDSYTARDENGDTYSFNSTTTDPSFDTVADTPEPAAAGAIGAAALGLLVRTRRKMTR